MKEAYAKSPDPLGLGLPSYILSLPSPMRRKHKDDLLISRSAIGSQSQDEFYNAWDEDIAIVNIFFGKETVMGRDALLIIMITPHDDRPMFHESQPDT